MLILEAKLLLIGVFHLAYVPVDSLGYIQFAQLGPFILLPSRSILSLLDQQLIINIGELAGEVDSLTPVYRG